MTPSQIEGMEIDGLVSAIFDSKVAMIDRLLCYAEWKKRINGLPMIYWIIFNNADRKSFHTTYMWNESDEVKKYINQLKGKQS